MLNHNKLELSDNINHNEYILLFNKIYDYAEEQDIGEDHFIIKMALEGLRESFGFSLAYSVNKCRSNGMREEEIKAKYKTVLSCRYAIDSLLGESLFII